MSDEGERQPLAGNGDSAINGQYAEGTTHQQYLSTSASNEQPKPSELAASTIYGSVEEGGVDEDKRSLRAHHPKGTNGGASRPRREIAQQQKEGDVLLLDKEGSQDLTSTFKSPLLYFATEEVTIFNPSDHPQAGAPIPRENDQGRPGSFLSPSEGRSKNPHMWTFRGRSPKFIRFGLLILITILPFGAHFTKNCFSSLEVYFLHDENLHFNDTKYGALISAISFPNLFMPFFGGLFLDAKGHNQGILLFLTITLLGHMIFLLAMAIDSFWLAMIGEALHGLGSGTVLVAMRAIVSKFFLENELTFALGVTVGGACVSKALAKASVAPIAETRWGYMGALWYVAFWQLLSLLAGVVYVRLAQSAHLHLGMKTEEVGHADFRPRSLMLALRRSTLAFWVVAVLHTLFLTAYHLFANFSGHFIVENYGVSPVLAGYMSSLQPLVVVFCAPLAGLVLDYWGGQIYVLLLANVVTTVAYFLLWQDQAGAVLCIVMLALCESFVPTILLSALPLTVDQSVYGAAFGMAEVISAFATIVSNVYFGFSRDQTESYHHDLAFLLWLCLACFFLTLFLLYWDTRFGRSKLNRPRKDYGFTSVAS